MSEKKKEMVCGSNLRGALPETAAYRSQTASKLNYSEHPLPYSA